MYRWSYSGYIQLWFSIHMRLGEEVETKDIVFLKNIVPPGEMLVHI